MSALAEVELDRLINSWAPRAWCCRNMAARLPPPLPLSLRPAARWGRAAGAAEPPPVLGRPPGPPRPLCGGGGHRRRCAERLNGFSRQMAVRSYVCSGLSCWAALSATPCLLSLPLFLVARTHFYSVPILGEISWVGEDWRKMWPAERKEGRKQGSKEARKE